MAQKITGIVKLQINAGKAMAGPPVGPSLAPHGINLMGFVKEFNERTKNDVGFKIPVVVTIYADRSFSFVTKAPPASALILKECGVESGSGIPNETKVAKITKAQLEKIAALKMRDLNAKDIDGAVSMLAGTCRSMGVVVEG